MITTIIGCSLLTLLIDKQYHLVTSLVHLQEALSHVHKEHAKAKLVHFHVEKSNRDLRRTMEHQFEYMRELTMSSRSRFIRVKGLPEDEKEDIEDKLLDLFGYLGMELGRGDIERANRVGKVKPNATHARLVNVELHSHAVKIELLRRGIRLRNTQMAIQDDLTNVKMANVIEPVHDHEDHPHDCGLLNFVAAPEDYGKVRKPFGAWFTDPLADDERIWTMEHFFKTKQFQEFASVSDLIAHRVSKTHKLPVPWGGTGHIAYNGSLYFNRFNTSTIIKYDLDKQEIVLERALKGSTFGNQASYQWAGYTDLDFAADEEGFWVIHSTYENTLDIVITRLDPENLDVLESFRTNWRKQWSANAFMACGVLYVLKKYDQKSTFINYAFDTHSKQFRHVTIPFEIRYGWISSLSYNHKEKRLYAWDKQHLVVYDLEFFNSTAKNTWMHLAQPGMLGLET